MMRMFLYALKKMTSARNRKFEKEVLNKIANLENKVDRCKI